MSRALSLLVALAAGCGTAPGLHAVASGSPAPVSPRTPPAVPASAPPPAASASGGDPVGSASASPPVVSPSPPAPPRPAFVVHVVDVGTGLAVFVEGPDFALVYDAGSNDDVAVGPQNRFLAYLRAVRPTLAGLDHVVLSHPHRDHVELLADALLTYPVAHVWEPGVLHPICGYRRFVGALSPSTRYHTASFDAGARSLDFGRSVCRLPARISVTHASRVVEGVPVSLGDRASMTFLHVDATARPDGLNDASLVTLLELDGARVLLMGDAEAGGRQSPSAPPKRGSAEGRVLERHRALIDADVLIVGHHGSKTSSRRAFVDAVSPRVSVISSGPTRYGRVTLPDAEVVELLGAAGELYRTDLDDAACAANPRKIGPDADGQAGGCDNVRVELRAGAVRAGYWRLAD